MQGSDQLLCFNEELDTNTLHLCCAAVTPFYLLPSFKNLFLVLARSLLAHSVQNYLGTLVWQKSEWEKKKQKEETFLCNKNFLHSSNN